MENGPKAGNGKKVEIEMEKGPKLDRGKNGQKMKTPSFFGHFFAIFAPVQLGAVFHFHSLFFYFRLLTAFHASPAGPNTGTESAILSRELSDSESCDSNRTIPRSL